MAGFYFVCNVVHADEPALYFYPELKWSVKRLNPDSNAPPVCAISNRLNNGYTVEMSGKSDAFDTIKIDFNQNAFQKGMKYEVQYFVPGASRLIVASEAEKPSMISSNLKQYSKFAKDLSNTGVMDIRIRNNQFRIYLTGLKSKIAAYNQCVSGIQVSSPHSQQGEINEKYTTSQPNTALRVAPPPPPVSDNEAIEYLDNAHNANAHNANIESTAQTTEQNEPRYIEILAEKIEQFKIKEDIIKVLDDYFQ